MELTMTLMAIIIITGLISSGLSLVAKLMYDGIKAKRNGNGNGKTSNNGQILVNFASLVKDIEFNNKRVTDIENGIVKLIEYSITSNVHLADLKASVINQTDSFRTLISALTSTMAKLESKLK